MPRVSVPEPIRAILARITGIPNGEFRTLVEALNAVPPSLRASKLTDQIRASLPKEIPDLGEIIQAVTSMNVARLNIAMPQDEFLREVAASIARDGVKGFDPSLFESRLLELLSVEAISLSGRAEYVQHQYEGFFTSARILSDIRTIFDESGSSPLGAVIVHNLKISYFRNGEYQEAFFALDNADLETMRKSLDRAELKTASLEAIIKKAGLKYLESK